MATRIVYAISTHCKLCEVLLFILWSVVADKLSVCDVFSVVARNVLHSDEFDGVGETLDLTSHAICQLSEFVCGQCAPVICSFRIAHELPLIY